VAGTALWRGCNSFSDPFGVVAVGNDNFQSGAQELSDIFVLISNFNNIGFTFAGLELREVFFSWLEGVAGVGEFLNDQSLPPVLPPTAGGLIELVFYGADGIPHRAFFNSIVVFEGPADTNSISFQGQLSSVIEDNGSATYSGVSIGSAFSGEFDPVTGFSSISDGTTVTSFSAYFENEGFVEVDNNFALDANVASFLNALQGPNFVAGNVIDALGFDFEALTQNGGNIFLELVYILDPLALDDESKDNYPPNPDDTLIIYFAITEKDAEGEDIYGAVGTFTLQEEPILPALNTVSSDGNPTDAVISGGVISDSGTILADTVTVGETISINTIITPEFGHVGQDLEVIVAVQVVATGDVILITSGGLVPYSTGDPLSIFVSIEGASASNNISILSGFTTTEAEVGSYNFFVGYLVTDGDGSLYYTSSPIALTIAN